MLRQPWPSPRSTSRDFLKGNDLEPIHMCEWVPGRSVIILQWKVRNGAEGQN